MRTHNKQFQQQELPKSMQAKFDNLKTKARKAAAYSRKHFNGTGGSSFKSDGLDGVLETALKTINIKTVVGLPYGFDSGLFVISMYINSISRTELMEGSTCVSDVSLSSVQIADKLSNVEFQTID
ncbi:hypothetical protein Trydic_g12567 [Trypoxylus dichotomus]